ncbi:HNH endonuclease [Pendulispora brunnea]|uniref:HNH endonuclease n=1 Tax=Pendulispora brunnea TaxID=2905690 RepID=A0ABZ2JXF5_9BACT
MKLADLSNAEVLSGLHALVGQGRVLLARLLAYLGEVEERRLDLEAAYSSLFDYCVRKLAMSEDEAWRRVTASRLVRRFPRILGMLERGEVHLTALLLLREHLTDENHEELLHAISTKTKAQVQQLLATRFPKPDAPSRVRPLSQDRYEVQFTATAELKEKIEHTTNLMRHANPSGELSVLVERALDLLIATLEKSRLGKTERPVTAPPGQSTRPGYVRRAVRRKVFERDGMQCTFVDETGQRCESRTFLELDHRKPRARGGSDEASNIRVRCKRHNGWSAERDFGRNFIDKRKAEHPRQRVHESDIALRALIGMGFKVHQVRHALGIIEKRPHGRPPSIEGVLREALLLLTR